MPKNEKTRDNSAISLNSKVYFSILIDQFNWFYFEDYVYTRSGIHAPMGLDDLFIIKEKLSVVEGEDVVYVDSLFVEKWLKKNGISTFNIIKNRLIEERRKQPEIYKLKSKQEQATILFTSGTHSSSKAVLLNHKNQNSSFQEFSNSIIFKGCKSYLNLLSHSFSGGRKVFYASVLAGLEIYSVQRRMTLVENLALYKPDLIACVPYMLKDLLVYLRGNGNKLGLKKIICGGARLDELVRIEFENHGIIIYNVYGLTETASLCSYPVDDDYMKGSAGKISENIQFKLSERSELLIKGDVLAIGYLEKGQIREFTDSNAYFNTKDIVEVDAERNIFIKGRTSSLVKTNKGKFINIEEFMDFMDFQRQNVDLHCLFSDKEHILAISSNIGFEDMEKVKAKLVLLGGLGIQFSKVFLYKSTKNYEGKPNKDIIFNNIVEEIKLNEN